jgi:hypothetical protein
MIPRPPTLMNSRPRTAAPAPGAALSPLAESLRADLSALYALSQASRHVFASPLGPFPAAGRPAYLPRFVFFGPNACDESWRVAFLAGFDHRDLRASRALVSLATRLVSDEETGHALNLTFFPVVDMGGLISGAAERGLSCAHWGREGVPEISLLAQDARQRAYHGFVRVESGAWDEDLICVGVRGAFAPAGSSDLELVTSEETRSLPVRFELENGHGEVGGPLSIADDLPFTPFELTLRIPGGWSDAAYQDAAVVLLERFLRRYRALQAYGQHL